MRSFTHPVPTFFLASALLLLIWIVPQPSERAPYLMTPALKQDLKAELRGPVKEPNDWFMAQRVGPDGTLNMDAVRAGRDRANVMRQQVSPLEETWLFEGPTNIGGRITALAVHPSNPSIVYAGGAIGGVFKSYDYGMNFTPIFEEDYAQSAGALAMDPNDPDRIWFGTGEANASGDSYPGVGIYLTEDAGVSWTYKGLPESYHIGRIVVDPTDSDRVFVAVAGKLFGTNTERGVYRTENGGDTWELVHYINETTGCIDIEINELNPAIVYAVMWERYRTPSTREVAGDDSGVWRSTDGGDTWQQLTNGLPNNDPNLGRGALAISPDNPDRLYLFHSGTPYPGSSSTPYYGSWRSDNGGDTWTSIDIGNYDDNLYSTFGWYFGESIVEPGNPDVIYVAGVEVIRSLNGGASWSTEFDDSHVDHHAFYIDPNNPSHVTSGHDGGLNRSTNRGSTSTVFNSLGATQFYAICHDPSHPERLYGGTQDNGTMRTVNGGTGDWDRIYGGDGFYCRVDPRDNGYVYAEWQNGNMVRSTNGGSSFYGISGWWGDRCNWMSPYCFDPFDYDRLYFGSYRVYRTNNNGNDWSTISGDLTDGDDPGSLTYGTITTIDASAVQPNYIVVGTDDANVWVTQNGGSNWTRIDSALPEMWVSRVAFHPTEANTIFCTFSGHRVSDPTPHVYRSDDLGANWYSVSGTGAGELPEGPVNDIIVDPDDPSRFYVATDFGVFFSTNEGDTWAALGQGLPMSAVFDIEFIASERRLVAGTHGRSMYSIALGNPAPVTLSVTPTSSTTIPAAGGTLVYTVSLQSSLAQSYPGVDFWTSVELQNGNEVGPLFHQVFTMTPFFNANVTGLTQDVPSNAPAGTHEFRVHIGLNVNNPLFTDSFSFTKLSNSVDGAGTVSRDWPAGGGSWIADEAADAAVPTGFVMHEAYPNPFNAMATLRVSLPEASDLTVTVVNTLGQTVARLVDGYTSAGTHELAFDATNLASGAYFIHASVPGQLNQTQKVMLVR
ncbi:T9SS type A sorting domain-containing protein [bacterium]|nr:T9SS type A sorting domain-containing protein [bacterium]